MAFLFLLGSSSIILSTQRQSHEVHGWNLHNSVKIYVLPARSKKKKTCFKQIYCFVLGLQESCSDISVDKAAGWRTRTNALWRMETQFPSTWAQHLLHINRFSQWLSCEAISRSNRVWTSGHESFPCTGWYTGTCPHTHSVGLPARILVTQLITSVPTV